MGYIYYSHVLKKLFESIIKSLFGEIRKRRANYDYCDEKNNNIQLPFS